MFHFAHGLHTETMSQIVKYLMQKTPIAANAEHLESDQLSL